MFPRLLPYLLAAFIVILPMVLRPGTMGAPMSLDDRQINASAVAQAILVQQQALLIWSRAHIGTTGPIAQSLLTRPAPWGTPYGVSSTIGNTALGTVAVTWYSSAQQLPGAVGGALTALHSSASDVGITGLQYLNSASGALIPLPAGVPSGVAAVADIVTP